MKKFFAVTMTLFAILGLVAPGVAGAAPAKALAGYQSRDCADSFECVWYFPQKADQSVMYNIQATGGPYEPIAVSVDTTVPGAADCHPTVYPGQYYHFNCNDGYMGGQMVLRVYAGNKHNYHMEIWF